MYHARMKRAIAPLLLAALLAGATAARAGDPAAAEAIRKARQDAAALLKKYGDTKDEAKRAEAAASLAAIDPRARVPALVDGLKHWRPDVRRFCIARLAEFKSPALVPHMVVLAASDADRTVRGEAHAAAVALDKEYARRWYEYVLIQDLGKKRFLAIEHLGEIASPASVPILATVVENVGLEVHVQQANLKGVEEARVNLGGAAGNANTSVPIELPQVELIDLHVNAQVPAEVQIAWRDAALGALRAIAGADLGAEPKAYRQWYSSHGGAPAK